MHYLTPHGVINVYSAISKKYATARRICMVISQRTLGDVNYLKMSKGLLITTRFLLYNMLTVVLCQWLSLLAFADISRQYQRR